MNITVGNEERTEHHGVFPFEKKQMQHSNRSY
jgi:hypothetical protein